MLTAVAFSSRLQVPNLKSLDSKVQVSFEEQTPTQQGELKFPVQLLLEQRVRASFVRARRQLNRALLVVGGVWQELRDASVDQKTSSL